MTTARVKTIYRVWDAGGCMVDCDVVTLTTDTLTLRSLDGNRRIKLRQRIPRTSLSNQPVPLYGRHEYEIISDERINKPEGGAT